MQCHFRSLHTQLKGLNDKSTKNLTFSSLSQIYLRYDLSLPPASELIGSRQASDTSFSVRQITPDEKQSVEIALLSTPHNCSQILTSQPPPISECKCIYSVKADSKRHAAGSWLVANGKCGYINRFQEQKRGRLNLRVS